VTNERKGFFPVRNVSITNTNLTLELRWFFSNLGS